MPETLSPLRTTLDSLLGKECVHRFTGRGLLGQGQDDEGVFIRADSGDQLPLVDDFPTFGKVHPKGHVRVIEDRSRDETLPGIDPEFHTVETPEILAVIDRSAQFLGGQLRDLVGQARRSSIGIGMGRLPLGKSGAARRLTLPVEHLEDLGRLPRIVMVSKKIPEPEGVRLFLVVAAELEEQNPQAHLSQS